MPTENHTDDHALTPRDQNQVHNFIIQDNNQDEPTVLDLDRNVIIVNQQFKDSLKQAPAVIDRAEKLVATDVTKLSEDDMSQLRKDFQPIVKYAKQYTDFEKQMKKLLRKRDEDMIGGYHKILSDAGFDKIPLLTKKYHAMDHDFKANRANQRWEQIQERFEASMTTYPELRKFAPNTLGSFNYYRVRHPKLISEAKNKPVNKATIKQFNEDMYQYHQDMTRLLQSTLSAAYYDRVIEQYADNPTTDNMLSLVEKALEQQVKDQNTKLMATVVPTAKQLLGALWFQNQKINQILDRPNANHTIDPEKYQLAKLRLMRSESDAIVAALNPAQFVQNGAIDRDNLELTLKPQLAIAMKRIYQKLLSAIPRPKSELAPNAKSNANVASNQPSNLTSKATATSGSIQAQVGVPNSLAQANAAQSGVKLQALGRPQQPVEPYVWLMDYLQATKRTDIHENDQRKVEVLADLFKNLTDDDAIWKHHMHSYHDIIKLVNYITNL